MQEIRTYAKDVYEECLEQFKQKNVKKGNAIYSAEQLRQITAGATFVIESNTYHQISNIGDERSEQFKAGDSFFVPAGERMITVKGACKMLVVRV